MDKLKLSVYIKGTNIDEIIENTYQLFNENFIKKEKRPLYKEKFIFFDTNRFIKNNNSSEIIELNKYERFYHIISISDKENLEVYPCYNTDEYELCEVKCETSKALGDFKHLNRVICLYRLSRIQRISEVIKLANENNKYIQQWESVKIDKNKKKTYNVYIRYTYGNDDYIVILKKKIKKEDFYYEFVTAFPVFLKRNKQQYDKMYMKSLTK